MSRIQLMTAARLSLAIACLTISLAAEARAGSYPDPTIALDSDVYQSDLVIEGRLTEGKKGQQANATNVRITNVYRGEAKVGENVIVLGLGDFQKSAGSVNVPLGPKDGLILFLKKAPAREISTQREGEEFVPLSEPSSFSELGVRLILRGSVHWFCDTTPNFFNASRRYPPFVTSTAPASGWSGADGQSVLAFRELLHSSATRAADWHNHLDRSQTHADMPWLISLLAQRYEPPPRPDGWWYWYTSDRVAADATTQLAKLRDFPAIDQAIRANPDQATGFSQVFATPQGRDFLLERVTDRSFPRAHRGQLASLLQYGGVVYSVHSSQSATTQPGSSEERIAPRNGSYLTRIATAAAGLSAAGDDDIADSLLSMLNNQFYGSRDSRRDPRINLDLLDAANVLREIYARKSTSGAIRFRVENVMYAIGDKEYATLQSSCGSMLTLAGPGNTNSAPANTITVGYEYRRTRDGESVKTTMLVLESVAGRNSYIVPSTMYPQRDAAPGGSRYGQESLPLPANFKPGKYRLHYRLMNGSNIVSEGNGFETTLPQLRTTALTGVFPWPAIPAAPTPWPRSRKAGILIAVIAVPTLFVLRAFVRSRRQYRRARKGLCPRCAYDLRFSRDRCPECGTPVSANIARGIVRKCIARIALTVAAILLVATTIAWVRSYRIADCWTRTTGARADSVYFSRGAIVLNLLTSAGQPGWTYEHGEPRAFPRSTAESGDLARWNMLGIEYSSLSDMLILPMWAPIALVTICGMLLVRGLRRQTLKVDVHGLPQIRAVDSEVLHSRRMNL